MTRPTLVDTPPFYEVEQRRTVTICIWSAFIAVGAVALCRFFIAVLALITNLSFYGQISLNESRQPWGSHLGPFIIVVPIIGALIIGLMARYGSGAIRGDGIPEAIDQILTNESKISPKVTILKPVSAAIAIGTGGPFGAEGPIIATGGALGSLLGQLLHTTPHERKTLVAAGAAAGITAIFGTPVAAVLLAIEVLLFEYRPRSLIPVSFASATAAGLRLTYTGSQGVFAMPTIAEPTGSALAVYVGIGALIGVAAVVGTKLLYWIEEMFERLPVHWMWWPAIGAIAVGVVGYIEPRTLGVGYDNIRAILAGQIAGGFLLGFVLLKYTSWAIALGSGTSGGTLAPLFTIGGGLGALLGTMVAHLAPSIGVDPRIAALVGMAAIFSGASRALLTSIVFAFETTRQPIGLLPLLGGCTSAFLISSLMMRYTIMTEKLARRGTFVPTEYIAAHPDELAKRDATAVRARNLELHPRLWKEGGRSREARKTEML